jgi:hypothetical protein
MTVSSDNSVLVGAHYGRAIASRNQPAIAAGAVRL